MASANLLSDDELTFIKGMLDLQPQPFDQVILSYFSRPGRDINHRVIREIRNGTRAAHLPPAPHDVVMAFMAAAKIHRGLTVRHFLWNDDAFIVPYRFLGRFRLDWWPAGQGLFASGTIQREGKEPLTWVYDCGTWPDLSVISESVDRFESSSRSWGVERIRLAVLSHFDNDHVTGFVQLLGKFEVQTLLIPFVPRWLRLQIALSQGLTPANDLFNFYLDPVTYLARAADGGIGEIVVVPAAGPDDRASDLPPDTAGPDVRPRGEAESLKRLGEDLKFRDGPVPEGADTPAGDLKAFPSVQVRYLAAGESLTIPNFWEFLPYNDAALAWKAPPTFLKAAEVLIADLLDHSRTDQAKTLDALKKHYEAVFKPGVERNVISLFLYSGPVGQRIELRWARDGRYGRPTSGQRFSQMHTGDGFLNTSARCTAFERYFRPGGRFDRSSFLQVMHHGSKANWRAGTARWLNPGTSLFCSDPDSGNHHPHAEVLRDFWCHRPIQVDGSKGYHLKGLLVAT